MARPRKRRRLRHQPQPAIFKPLGAPLESLERITLLHEELEALRLADLDRRHQVDAATQMGISRSTFQRLISEARHKVAQALVSGAALQIEGGTFRLTSARWYCSNCTHEWELPHGRGLGPPDTCPNCGSREITEEPAEDR
jgi:predicted DNA-binding protein (UPF0251 family)